MLPPFKKAIPLLERIENSGYEAYFVGGSVRDSLLGREISDVDIATSALPEELKTIFPQTADIGIEHGTILVIYKGIPYEITTFRAESEYSDFRRPDKVEFIRSLTEDLKRRDFTMNAIAMDRAGGLIDPFNGQEAIRTKQIVTVGEAAERFGEDALRMMRAVRFVSQLGFTIETNTLSALSTMPHLLEKIAVERKLAEFEKLLEGPSRTEALSILVQTSLYKFLPGLKGSGTSLHRMIHCSLSTLSRVEMWTLLVYQLHLNEQESGRFLRDWKLPVKQIKEVLKTLHWFRFRLHNQWTAMDVYRAGKEVMLSAEKLIQSSLGIEPVLNADLVKLFECLPIKNRTELDMTGTDLLSWFNRKPGPWVKDYLQLIEEKVIKGELVNERANIREWLVNCNRKLEKD
ncbi:tRNA nucleotidyltransferase (CCA-adding enzyme) [Mesobacillus persicus]|uniref:CCA-adding enzyme n=1 Tax=Mesobacillus persicus TaxID=930146 RepID=A0A1H8BMZ0_9BACI|nr:CCA tRNA nucleotidyltransferase [Mesobacillus persicus]SEM84163.1 tRNA nucleotidyltransferase (CCA-adding enzyme) [Mesobacillus persicus]